MACALRSKPVTTRHLGYAAPRRLRKAFTVQSRSDEGGSGERDGVRSVLSFLCPLLNVFSGNDLREPRARWYEVASSGLASISRLPYGSNATAHATTPALPIRIYEFEACPFCRRVREAVTDLDMTVDVFPCPKEGQLNRAVVAEAGGKLQFPFMVDENTGTQLYESDAIVKYLYSTYGESAEPPRGMLETTLLTGWMPTLFRAGRGMTRYGRRIAETPPELLQLYNYENNQFSRLVGHSSVVSCTERWCSAGKGSQNSERLKEVSGATTVPFLVDPNTGRSVGDSEKIIEYLVEQYTTP